MGRRARPFGPVRPSVGSSEKGGVDLDDVAAELLELPLDQFTARRNARAKELKAAGKAELASKVAALKKPPVHLWAANRAARGNQGLLRKLRDAAQSVARAQTGSRTPRELRAASEAFQGALDAAVKAAIETLRGDKHASTEEAERRIREIFRVATMQNGEVLDRLQKGALVTEPAAGDDVLTMFQAGAPPERESSRAPTSAGEDPHAARAAERTARLDAERAEQLQTSARRLRAEADEAAAQAQRADGRPRAAQKEAAQARAQAKKSARALGGR